jgi:hypothetical protein
MKLTIHTCITATSEYSYVQLGPGPPAIRQAITSRERYLLRERYLRRRRIHAAYEPSKMIVAISEKHTFFWVKKHVGSVDLKDVISYLYSDI